MQIDPNTQAPMGGTDASAPDVQSEWQNWLGNDANRAAMMQFGIALTQPMGWGQNTIGHIGSALGSAGEAAGRTQAAQRAQDQSDSKATLREAQAQTAEARAGVAQAQSGLAEGKLGIAEGKLGLAGQKLGLDAQRLQQQQDLGYIQRSAPLMKMYQDQIANDKLMGQPLTKIEDFIKNHKQLIEALKVQDGGGRGGGKAFNDGDVQTFNGVRYRYDASKGPASSREAWIAQ